MSSAAIPGFLPSLHGFRFANRWPAGPTVTFGPFDPRILGVCASGDHGRVAVSRGATTPGWGGP
jgi:hypothetical protein